MIYRNAIHFNNYYIIGNFSIAVDLTNLNILSWIVVLVVVVAQSNQQNLGTIRSSNLCTEIVQFTSPDEVAVCNLASVNLSAFVDEADKSFDFQKLLEVTKVVTRNLNKVIDINFYPVMEAKNSNFRHRPIG